MSRGRIASVSRVTSKISRDRLPAIRSNACCWVSFMTAKAPLDSAARRESSNVRSNSRRLEKRSRLTSVGN